MNAMLVYEFVSECVELQCEFCKGTRFMCIFVMAQWKEDKSLGRIEEGRPLLMSFKLAFMCFHVIRTVLLFVSGRILMPSIHPCAIVILTDGRVYFRM